MAEHVLKTVEPYYSAVVEGRKTFDLRRNDRAYQAGDVLVLIPPTAHAFDCDAPNCKDSKEDIAAAERRTVTFVFSGDPALRDLGGVVPGYVILALAPTSTEGGDVRDL